MKNSDLKEFLRRRRRKLSVYFVVSAVLIVCVILLLSMSMTGAEQRAEKYLKHITGLEDQNISSMECPFSVHFIDVNSGDSILIRSESNIILIDTGEYSYNGDVSSYLKRLGIDHIDLFAASHTDSDHIGDFADIAGKIPIGKVWISRFCQKPEKDYSEDEKIFYDTIEALGIPVEYPEIGTYLSDDIVIEVLSPETKQKSDNDNSLVMKIKYRNRSFLFMGDAGAKTEKFLIESGKNIHSDILKVGHHGSNSGTTDKFLKYAAPDCAVITSGVQNKNLPSRKCIDRLNNYGCQILRTDLEGTIILVYDNGEIKKYS